MCDGKDTRLEVSHKHREQYVSPILPGDGVNWANASATGGLSGFVVAIAKGAPPERTRSFSWMPSVCSTRPKQAVHSYCTVLYCTFHSRAIDTINVS